MKRKELIRTAPCSPPADNFEMNVVAESQILELEGRKIIEIDLYQGKELKARYFADEEQRASCVWMAGSGWKKIKLNNAARIVQGMDAVHGWNYGYMDYTWTSQEDRKRAADYLHDISVESWEEEISSEYRRNAECRKLERIREKMNRLPGVPDDFREYVMEKAYRNDHYLYYSKEGSFCSRCGRTVTLEQKPRHNQEGWCPLCGKRILYKHTGRKREHDARREVLYIMQWENDIILRYFKCSLLSGMDRKEDLEFTESVRTYHDGRIKSYTKRYVQYEDMQKNLFWSDKMYQGYTVSYGVRTCLYTGNREELRLLIEDRWAGILIEFGEKGEALPLKGMLAGYTESPVIFEKLYKAGLKHLSLEYIRTGRIRLKKRQGELRKMLGITRTALRYMARNDSRSSVLAVFQDAKEHSFGLNDREIEELAEAGICAGELAAVAKKTKLVKTLHYLEKAHGYRNLHDRYIHYRDYIGMAQTLGYDMSNDTVRYPEDVKKAHDRMIREFDVLKLDQRKKEVLARYSNIRNISGRLDQMYGFRSEKYLVRAPKDAAEIVDEGRTLHHCVASGDGYLKKHNEERTYILLMRKEENLEESYYTIEFDPHQMKIIQYYGENDGKPDQKQVDGFLKKWMKEIMQRTAEHTARAAG